MVLGSSRFPSTRCWIQRVQEPGSGPLLGSLAPEYDAAQVRVALEIVAGISRAGESTRLDDQND